MDKNIALNPNEVVAFLQKRPQDFTREDMLRFICENGIRMIDGILQALRAHDDANLHEAARKNPDLMRSLVDQYFDCG